LVIRVGDSMRPYGLGIALTLLTLAATWKLIAVENNAPTNKKALWLSVALFSAVLSVQTLYQCALFIAVFSCSAWVIVLKRRDWKSVVAITIIAAISAASLLPYIPIYLKGRPGYAIAHTNVSFGAILKAIASVWNFAGPWGSWEWI